MDYLWMGFKLWSLFRVFGCHNLRFNNCLLREYCIKEDINSDRQH